MADMKMDKDVHIDPVCGMKITEDEATGSSRHDGQKYYFCSNECKRQFEAAPESFTTSVIPK